jgi:hypothetical protein
MTGRVVVRACLRIWFPSKYLVCRAVNGLQAEDYFNGPRTGGYFKTVISTSPRRRLRRAIFEGEYGGEIDAQAPFGVEVR